MSMEPTTPTLPKGWKREEVVRKGGISRGKKDIYVISPRGKIFRSKKELAQYINENKLPLNIENFNFSRKNNSKNPTSIKDDSVSSGSSHNASLIRNSPLNVENQHISNILDESNLSLNTENINISTKNNNSNKNVSVRSAKSPKNSKKVTIISNNSLNNENQFICNTRDEDLSNSLQGPKLEENICEPSVNRLLGPEWLSDDIIRRYFDVINNTLFYLGNCMCMNPTIAHAIKILNDFTFLLDPLDIQNADYLFIPVNDCNEGEIQEALRGSHWTLLVYEKKTTTFYHFDSILRYNLKHAKATAEKCYSYLLKSNKKIMKFIDCHSPQQSNSYDCGVFMIIMAEYIGSYVQQKNNKECSLQDLKPPTLTDIEVITKRSQIAYVLLNRTISRDIIRGLFFRYISETNQEEINSTKPEFKAIGRKQQVHHTELKDLDKCERIKHVQAKHKQKRSISEPKVDNSDYQIDINIYSDSMGRDLTQALEAVNSKRKEDMKIFGFCKPGAPLKEVVSEIQLPKNASERMCNVIVAGANDAACGDIGSVFTALDNFLKNQPKTINLIATVPFRYDIPSYHYFNLKVEEANQYIKEIVSRYETAHVIDLGQLRRSHFTKHGFHMNRRGKYVLANKIYNTWKNFTRTQPNEQQTDVSSPIEVIDTSMGLLNDGKSDGSASPLSCTPVNEGATPRRSRQLSEAHDAETRPENTDQHHLTSSLQPVDSISDSHNVSQVLPGEALFSEVVSGASAKSVADINSPFLNHRKHVKKIK